MWKENSDGFRDPVATLKIFFMAYSVWGKILGRNSPIGIPSITLLLPLIIYAYLVPFWAAVPMRFNSLVVSDVHIKVWNWRKQFSFFYLHYHVESVPSGFHFASVSSLSNTHKFWYCVPVQCSHFQIRFPVRGVMYKFASGNYSS